MAATRKRGGHWCSAINCTNSRIKRPDLSFFRFPAEKERCDKWIQNCRREDLRKQDSVHLNSCYYMCGEHFEEDMFMDRVKKIKLIWSAVPTLFAVSNPPPKIAPKRKLPTRNIPLIKKGKNTPAQVSESSKTIRSIDEPEACCSAALPALAAPVDIAPAPTANTPRKKRFQNTINSLRVKVCRLRKKKAVQPSATTTKKPSVEEVTEAVGHYLSGPAFQLVQAQLQLAAGNKFSHRWSAGMKKLAITLYHQGPRTYRFLSKMLKLPTRQTLARWLKAADVRVGFDESVLGPLKDKVNTLNPKDRYCVVCFDEMSLKTGLDYDCTNDIIEGVEDYGKFGRTNRVANHALVFMVRGVTVNWKQPLGYYFSCDCAPAEKLRSILLECIRLLFAMGLYVVATVSDLSGFNRKMYCTELGVTGEKPYFEFDTHRIFALFDVPHLIKCCRNNIWKYDLKIGNKTVRWRHIAQFADLDMKQPVRMAPKITTKHLNLPPFSKMRVCLATQILSHTVSAGMYVYCSLGILPQEAVYTAEFIERMDSLFDCLNSRSVKSKKELTRPISANSSHRGFLVGCHDWLKTWEFETPPTVNIHFVKGFLQTINGIIQLWDTFGERMSHEHTADKEVATCQLPKLKYLMTSRLNQDAVENLFCLIRQSGGTRDNPTPQQFRQSFKIQLVTHLMKPVKGSNCINDDDQLILTLTDFAKQRNEECEEPVVPVTNSVPILQNDFGNDTIQLPTINTLQYIAGYLLNKSLASHVCDSNQCQKLYVKDPVMSNNGQLFIYFKAFTKKDNSDFGKLWVPSLEFAEVVELMEKCFISSFRNFLYKVNVGKTILAHVQNVVGVKLSCLCCPLMASKLINLFVRTRLYYALRFLNRDLANEKLKKKKPGKYPNSYICDFCNIPLLNLLLPYCCYRNYGIVCLF